MLPPTETREVTDLPGGARLVVREVRPSDAGGLDELFASLSAEDHYRRFFSCFRPGTGFFERLASIRERGGAALLAEVSGGDEPAVIAAEADYTLLPNGNGELSMVARAPFRGWLAPYLLDRLAAVAHRRGVRNLEADVLSMNGPMLAVLRHRGMALVPIDDWSVLRLCIGTSGARPTWPPLASSPRVLVEVPGGRWTGAAPAPGLAVLACPGPTRTVRCPVLSGDRCPLADGADVIIAVPTAEDPSWTQVLEDHRRRRGAELHVVERPTDVGDALAAVAMDTGGHRVPR